MDLYYSFTADTIPEINEVGGKALALILMSKANLPVPQGVVLTTSFFDVWFEKLKQSDEWNDYVNADDSDLSTYCAAIKKKAVSYDFTAEQKSCLDAVLEQLSNKKMGLYAVRSSSPEEDLAGASFAGGYETVLGVTGSTLNDAIREVFVSSLDERIYHYKVQHGFDPFNPSIAVIIQDQIASEIAGVAFSINPINNCFDEAVINANFGLGETVVSGNVTPDTFIVDKISKEILSKIKGEKGISIYLNPAGGTVTRDSEKDELTLSDIKVIDVCDLLEKVENYFNKPIDMEWAIVKNKIFALQARPITAYIPLAEEMLTKPGEQKKLYLDTFITQQGNSNPFSVLGLDVYELAQKTAYKKTMGSESFIDREGGLAFNCGGRSYLNLSNYFKVAGKKQSIRLFKSQDILSYKIIMELDIKHYVTPKTPPGLKGFVFKMMIGGIGTLKPMMKAYRKPTEYKELLLQEAKDLKNGLREQYNADLPFHTFVDKTNDIVTHFSFDVSLGAILATEIAKMNLKKLFKNMSDSIKESIVYLEQALPDNITIEMGLAMFKLACSPEITQCENGAQFNEQLGNRTFSKQFLQAWDTFIEEYGFRCPGELDLAVSRFSDTPELFFEQLKDLSVLKESDNDPQRVYDKGVERRGKTYKQLMDLLPRSKRRKFEKYYTILTYFAAYRELPKYYSIKRLGLIRKHAEQYGRKWTSEGRLNQWDQVFDLNISDIKQAISDNKLDIMQRASSNTGFLKEIAKTRNFPRLIDSRGRILHLPTNIDDDKLLMGEPISPGIVRGKVRVLTSPTGEKLQPGEILVTKATDPGWTPLFLSAGGIVLEVGGLLQHGALVAREYCKPCVAGIEHIASILETGQEIEIDGSNGTIQILHAEK